MAPIPTRPLAKSSQDKPAILVIASAIRSIPAQRTTIFFVAFVPSLSLPNLAIVTVANVSDAIITPMAMLAFFKDSLSSLASMNNEPAKIATDKAIFMRTRASRSFWPPFRTSTRSFNVAGILSRLSNNFFAESNVDLNVFTKVNILYARVPFVVTSRSLMTSSLLMLSAKPFIAAPADLNHPQIRSQ